MYNDQQARIAGAVHSFYDCEQQLKPPRDRSPVESAIDGIADDIGKLEAIAELFEQRLGSVLQPEVPQPVGAGAGQTASPVSPVVAYLGEQRRRMQSTMDRFGRMLSRLDI